MAMQKRVKQLLTSLMLGERTPSSNRALVGSRAW